MECCHGLLQVFFTRLACVDPASWSCKETVSPLAQVCHIGLKQRLWVIFVCGMDDDVDALALEIRRLRQKDYAARRRREATTGLTVWTLRTALCIACICNWDFTLAAAWVASRRRRGAQALDLGENFDIQESLEQVFIDKDIYELTHWVDPDEGGVQQYSVVKTAVAWVAGKRAAQYVQDLNNRVGQAVRSAGVIEHFNDFIRDRYQQFDIVEIPPVIHNAGKQWMRRWRLKHGGTIGRIRSVENVTVEEIRTKAFAPTSRHV